MPETLHTALPVFVYWDDPDTLPVYLQRCIDTWEEHGKLEEVVFLSDGNLAQWIDRDMLNWQALGQYSVAEKKDVIEIAVLSVHGGLFLDADTIMVAPPHAILNALSKSEIALYGNHMGAIAARKGCAFMRDWLEQLRRKLDQPRQTMSQPLGNMAYEALRDQYAGVTGYPRLLRKLVRGAAFTLGKRKYVSRLDRRSSGFMPELIDTPGSNHYQRYRSFWFSEEIAVERVFVEGQSLIGLHNSWNPVEYNVLDESGFRNDQSLLSRTLQFLERGGRED